MSSTADRKVAQAIANYQAGKQFEAKATLENVISHNPRHFGALHILGIIKGLEGQHLSASQLLLRAVEAEPHNPLALFNLAKAQEESGDKELAIQNLERSTNIDPRNPDGWLNLGKLLNAVHRYKEGLTALNRSLEIRPKTASAWLNKGVSLVGLGKSQEATLAFDEAISLDPSIAGAWANQAIAFANLRKFLESGNCADKATNLDPKLAEGWYAKGFALQQLGLADDAIGSFKSCLEIEPKHVDSLMGLGIIYSDQRKFQEAMHEMAEAYRISGYAAVLAALVHQRQMCCDWLTYERDRENLKSKIASGEPSGAQFALLSSGLGVTDLFKAAVKQAEYIDTAILPWNNQERLDNSGKNPPTNPPPNKLRLGYVSSDWHIHPVGQLTQHLLANHDKSQFEVFGYFLTPPWDHPTTKRIQASFDQWFDVSETSHEDCIRLMRSHNLDIAIDLNGYTKHNRLELFANRIAPIQATYLGHPGTTGAKWMDYILADEHTIPTEHAPFYSEQIARLPNSFFITHDLEFHKETILSRVLDKKSQGLPENAFVFSCFNNNYKIDPISFASWMNILHRTPQAVLCLSPREQIARSNLKAAAEKHGIAPDRIYFSDAMPQHADHLRRLSVADLFLDTHIYNAHTTACESLMMGVPVLTCTGETFAGRVATSMLHALHMPELITETLAEYENLAVELASDQEMLRKIKEKLWSNRLSAPLFDCVKTTRHIEAAFKQMVKQHQGGQAPTSFQISNE